MEKIILLLMLISAANKDNSKGLVDINQYINNLQIDPRYTEEKIKLARKIAPLMPSEYIQPISRSIYITESLVKIMELNDYMSNKTPVMQTAHIPIEDNRERLSRIVSVIQEEIPRSNMQNIGTVLELITNIDRYKKMFELMSVFMKNQSVTKDADKLAKMVEPMMKGKSSTDGEGSLDIEKIMNIMTLLNKSKDKTSTTEQKTYNQNEKVKEESPIEPEIITKNKLDLEDKIQEDIPIKLDYGENIEDTQDIEIIQEKEKPKKN